MFHLLPHKSSFYGKLIFILLLVNAWHENINIQIIIPKIKSYSSFTCFAPELLRLHYGWTKSSITCITKKCKTNSTCGKNSCQGITSSVDLPKVIHLLLKAVV